MPFCWAMDEFHRKKGFFNRVGCENMFVIDIVVETNEMRNTMPRIKIDYHVIAEALFDG